jgi:tetratricopeptide (TPR) repeat protein
MPERISEGIFSEKTLLYFFPEILYYLRVIFFPGRYYIQPQIYLPDSFSDIWFYVFAFVFLSIAVLSVFVKNPLVRLSAGIWFFSVLPVSFINLKNNPVNEYWAYFPSIASCLIVSGLLLRADKLKKLFKFTNSMIAAAFVFTLLFLLCMSRNPVYSNNYSFYTDALEKRQDVPMYYINLAQVYDEKADLKKVEELLYRAVEIDPQTKGAYLNLGTVSVKKGDLESAVKFFKKELELDPDSLTSYISLVKIYMYMDKKEDVVSTAETAFKKFDNSLFVSSELYPVAVDSYSSGKKEIALAILQTILSVTPDFDSAYISIGSIYAHQQDYKNAIFYWQYFLDHFPRNKEAVNVKLWLQDVRDKMKEQNEK